MCGEQTEGRDGEIMEVSEEPVAKTQVRVDIGLYQSDCWEDGDKQLNFGQIWKVKPSTTSAHLTFSATL